MKVYVVTLSSAKERQDNIASQLDPTGISYEFFDAVDGRLGKNTLLGRYNEKKRLKVKGEALLPGQLGCFASHYLLWQKCVDENKPIIVIEDDAKINAVRLNEFISCVPQLDSRYECVRLFRNKSRVRKAVPLESIGELSFCKFLKGHMSTTGYYLTPSGAAKYLKGAHEWLLPVDIYMDQFWLNEVECYGVEPPCLTNDESFDSTIQYIPKRKKKRRSLKVKMNREFYLLKNNMLRFLWNLKFVSRARKWFERIHY